MRVFSLAPYNVNVERRLPKPQGASLHEAQAEFFYVIDGSATLLTGGTLVAPTRTGTNLAGTGIEGGTRQPFSKGDFLIVPSGVAAPVRRHPGARAAAVAVPAQRAPIAMRRLVLLASLIVYGCGPSPVSAPLAAPGAAGAAAATAAPFPSGVLVDLSHTYDATTVFWPTAETYRLDKVADGMTPGGYYYAANNFFSSEHGGTHLDAPVHFAKGGQPVDQVPLERLFGEAYVIDVVAQAAANADHQISVEDIAAAGARAGADPATAIVLLRTGFSSRWPDAARYLGTAERGEAAAREAALPGSPPRRRALARGQPHVQGHRHRHGEHRLRARRRPSNRTACCTSATSRHSRT